MLALVLRRVWFVNVESHLFKQCQTVYLGLRVEFSMNVSGVRYVQTHTDLFRI